MFVCVCVCVCVPRPVTMRVPVARLWPRLAGSAPVAGAPPPHAPTASMSFVIYMSYSGYIAVLVPSFVALPPVRFAMPTPALALCAAAGHSRTLHRHLLSLCHLRRLLHRHLPLCRLRPLLLLLLHHSCRSTCGGIITGDTARVPPPCCCTGAFPSCVSPLRRH